MYETRATPAPTKGKKKKRSVQKQHKYSWSCFHKFRVAFKTKK